MGEATGQVKSVDELNKINVEIKSSAPEPDQDASQIRTGIEKTRSDMSETINALQDKLDPSKIAEQVKDQIREKATEAYDTAKSAVREATIGKAEKIMSSVSETVSDITGRAGTAVSDSSSSVVQYIRDNPVPFALLGIGLGMLAVNKRRSEPSYSYNAGGYSPAPSSGSSPLMDRAKNAAGGVADSAREAASSVADTARTAADRTTTAVASAANTVRDAASSAMDTTRQQYHDVSNQARQGAKAATDFFSTTMQDSPMAAGIVALALGAAVGLSLPSTEVEGQYMGEARDKFMEQAKSVASEAAGKVQHVAEEAGKTFKDVAQKEGLTS